MLKTLPFTLVISRFLAAPLLLWDAWDGKTSVWFIAIYIWAFLSDIFDGIIARKLGVSTAKLRQADSWADVCLYLGVAASVWLTHRNLILAMQMPLLAIISAQLLWWIVNLAKYGKPASYHTYSAKLWGISLFIATIAIFSSNRPEIALWIAIIIGIVHTLEEIAMTLILPTWQHDVLSIFHALKLKQDLLTH